ncbi:MAG: ABC transporter permease [Solirubrobacteraceae bacterium]
MSETRKSEVATVETKTALEGIPAGGHSRRAAAVATARRLRLRTWLPPLIAFAGVALAWELYATAHPFAIPTIERIVDNLNASPQLYWSNFLTTLREIAVGGGGGIAVAFLLAILMAELPIAESALMPLFVVLMVTPLIAIAPAFVLAFGYGVLPKYLVTGVVVFYPMLVNTLAGLRDVDPRAFDVFTTLHASRLETFWRLRLPSSLPFIFAGLKIALPLSIVGATIAEFVASGTQAGLGSLIEVAAQQANISVIWASTLLLCLLGIVFVTLLAVIRAKLVWWDKAGQKRT